MFDRTADPVLISDSRVLAVPIEECGEPLVDLREYPLLATIEHPRVGRRCETQLHCREGVARRLVEADSALPDGVRLLVLECHRTIGRQRANWERHLRELRELHPDWSEGRLAQENARLVAPPDEAPPHSTGGAVDVTLVDAATLGELDMGAPVNLRGSLSYTSSRQITRGARRNRLKLLKAMEEAGFVNYGYEWWHYSHGDRYWAYSTGAPAARYASV
jgi:D-alanyl-D-alanine dipeptidase